MVALKTERRVYMWHVMPKPAPSDAPVAVDMAEIIGILKVAHAGKTAEIYLSGEATILPPDADAALKDRKNRVYIADVAEDQNTITFLINRGDPYVADTAFIDAVKGTVRTVPPDRNESQGWSAHLVIAKAPHGRHEHEHRACYERMPHTTSWFAEQLIRAILERHAATSRKYVYEKRVRKGKREIVEQRRYRPHFGVTKVPSESIKKDIENGELSTITLIETKPEYRGPDAPDVVKSVEHKMIIRTKPAASKKILDYVKTISPWARKEGFDQIQLRVEGLPGGTSAQPRFELEKGDATETLYVRTQRLTGFALLERFARSRKRCSTSPTSKARRARSARSKWPRRAATIC